MSVLGILLGVLVVFVITAATGYFVAQEFGYMAVDRARLRAGAAAGDARARRALGVTGRTSFMLSGAQLGITVTGLLAGYVAEPLIGNGIGDLLGGVGVPTGVGVAVGAAVALIVVTVVQMVFGELFPKNLAIARPTPVAMALALSTSAYLGAFGWLIKIFDASSNLLLRAVRIEPVHDVEHSATLRDLKSIIDDSRESGDLPSDLSTLLDRVLGFTGRHARTAMIPRPLVATVAADTPVAELVGRMRSGHSRYPVVGRGVDDVVGIVCLRDVLALPESELGHRTVREIVRRPVLVPDSLRLPEVLERLREADDEIACVLDEYGGFAGVITMEDIAEELVGEIGDEHDPDVVVEPRRGDGDGDWTVPGATAVEEVERIVDHPMPDGGYDTIGGLVLAELGRLPQPGDAVTVTLPPDPDPDATPPGRLTLTVLSVERRVPATVRLAWADAPETGTAGEHAGTGRADGAGAARSRHTTVAAGERVEQEQVDR